MLKAGISDIENSLWSPLVIHSTTEARWPKCIPFFLSDLWKLNSPMSAQYLNKRPQKSEIAEERTDEYGFVAWWILDQRS